MAELYDLSTDVADAFSGDEIADVDGADIPDMDDWGDFDLPDADEIDLSEGSDLSLPDTGDLDVPDGDISEAEKASDYARSFGFDKAAEYIEKHYDGDAFVPGEPIKIRTRNMALSGGSAANGVPFVRRTAMLDDGLSVEGVFPEFDSLHHVELGQEAKDLTIRQQFKLCKDDLQEHLYDDPSLKQALTFGDMLRLESPQGYTPEGYTWQHQPETGSFDLVHTKEHAAAGHTGGNALW